jgi:Transposase zinc-ribbon domain
MAPADGLRRSIKGLSEAEFRGRFGTEEACRKALFDMRWREGLTCRGCGHRGFCRLKTRELFQCKRQVRLTAGTVFQDTKLPLTAWFAAIYHLTRSKGGISSIELGRRLGVKRQTAWLVEQKLMRVMAEREAAKPKLAGRVEVDPPVPPRGPEGRLPTSAGSGRAASGAGARPARRRSSPPWRPRPSAGRSGCGSAW